MTACEILIRAIAESKLCVGDTVLPAPETCSGNCAECIRKAVDAAKKLYTQHDKTAENRDNV